MLSTTGFTLRAPLSFHVCGPVLDTLARTEEPAGGGQETITLGWSVFGYGQRARFETYPRQRTVVIGRHVLDIEGELAMTCPSCSLMDMSTQNSRTLPTARAQVNHH